MTDPQRYYELHGIPLGYNFRIFTYGPFDSEVLTDLSAACSLNSLSEKVVGFSRGYGFEITPSTHADELGRQLAADAREIAAAPHAVIDKFGVLGAGELELRSTIVFVDREFARADEPIAAHALAERVREIKPHFSDGVIRERVNEMDRDSLLVSRRLAGP